MILTNRLAAALEPRCRGAIYVAIYHQKKYFLRTPVRLNSYAVIDSLAGRSVPHATIDVALSNINCNR